MPFLRFRLPVLCIPMRKFFTPNLDGRGRLVRALAGIALVTAGMFACRIGLWLSTLLIISGGFSLYEASRGWCLMRACGIKTRL